MATPVHAAARLGWKVVNPFRLFTDPKDTKRHADVFKSLTEEERLNPVLSSERRLAAVHEWGWAADVVDRVCWDAEANRYRCKESKDYVKPAEHAIEARLEVLPEKITADEICVWRVVVRKRRGRPVETEAVAKPCGEAVTLTIPYPHGAMVRATIGERVVAEERVAVEDLFVVGLGDSFGSGEGNPDVAVKFSAEREAFYGNLSKTVALSGYPARIGQWREIGDAAFNKNNAVWMDQACHRSLYSHQLRTALQLALEDPHRAVTFAGYACSGAEVTKGLFVRYKGNEWVPTPPDLSQVSAVSQAQCGGREAVEKDYPEAYHMRGKIADLKGGLVLRKCARRHARKIDLLLLSIGGNDIGFARLVANAVLPEKTILKRLGGWFGQVYGKSDAVAPLAELKARYKSLRRVFHNILYIPWNESDRVVLTGYPGMALLEDGKSVCPSGQSGMEVLPAYGLNSARARDGEEVAERLHALMQAEARRNGWRFAERHRAAFRGRGICAGGAGDGIKAADDLRFPRKINGKWDPYNPADYRPYVPRRRWFRTPNDAFLTGNFHVTGSVMKRVLRQKSLLWTQVLLASTYSGAFHPTAEGHAAIADAAVEQARGVLARYGRTSNYTR